MEGCGEGGSAINCRQYVEKVVKKDCGPCSWLVGVMRRFCASEPQRHAFCRSPHPDSRYVSFDVVSNALDCV